MLFPALLSLFLVAAPVLASYTPQSTACPTIPLVRAALGLSDDEETYRVARKAVADGALKSWLYDLDPGFGTAGELPTVSRST